MDLSTHPHYPKLLDLLDEHHGNTRLALADWFEYMAMLEGALDGIDVDELDSAREHCLREFTTLYEHRDLCGHDEQLDYLAELRKRRQDALAPLLEHLTYRQTADYVGIPLKQVIVHAISPNGVNCDAVADADDAMQRLAGGTIDEIGPWAREHGVTRPLVRHLMARHGVERTVSGCRTWPDDLRQRAWELQDEGLGYSAMRKQLLVEFDLDPEVFKYNSAVALVRYRHKQEIAA